MEKGDIKDEKVVFFTSHIQLEKIEDYRFAQRLSSRSEAVRKLIEVGLETLDEKKKTETKRGGGLLKAAEPQEGYAITKTHTKDESTHTKDEEPSGDSK
jgi:metal-responsive CopG/Arc/MetJ family transcriptional regulator